jgi:NitT/TauT family transport system substrate-binding protein
MHIMRSRRDFLTTLSVAAAAGVLGARRSLADEPPPEVTTIRLWREAVPNIVNGFSDVAICFGPQYVAEDLLRAEGFTEIHYTPLPSGPALAEAFERGEIDFTSRFAPGALRHLDAGVPFTVLAGLHLGCMELVAHDPIRTVADLKGKHVGINAGPGSADQLFVSITAAYVGLDPEKDINWVFAGDDIDPKQLFLQGKVDAYNASTADAWELRARKIGHVILDVGLDRPWSQYFCCILVGHRDFVRQYPVATKRAVRAILKATDLCATEPAQAAQRLADRGFAPQYDYAFQTLKELPYNVWREFDPEDALRFWALWMHQFGLIKSTPNQLLAEGTDWRFLNELKRELKA